MCGRNRLQELYPIILCYICPSLVYLGAGIFIFLGFLKYYYRIEKRNGLPFLFSQCFFLHYMTGRL